MPRFAAVINCMDGRTQIPVLRHVQRRTGAEFVDSITEAGADGVLARGGRGAAVAAIKRRLRISILVHGTKTCYVVAHYRCAGNPVGKAAHLKALSRAVARVRSWEPRLKIVPVWVDGKKKVHEVRRGGTGRAKGGGAWI